jgi:uncharacterized protein YbjT (DUF2867 family)
MNAVFVTGGTGYIGRPLIETLLERGHGIYALVRAGSEGKLPIGAVPVIGDALDPSTFDSAIPAGATVVHLVGTPHPSPAKAAEFKRVDLTSIMATTLAAQIGGARHLVYVSVAHPAPVMRAYIEVREAGESLIRATGIPATIVRPWYVLGPGHRWPNLLLPLYAALRRFGPTRAAAERLGLVTREQMIATLVSAVETPPSEGVRIVEVPEIRAAGARRD